MARATILKFTPVGGPNGALVPQTEWDLRPSNITKHRCVAWKEVAAALEQSTKSPSPGEASGSLANRGSLVSSPRTTTELTQLRNGNLMHNI